MTSTDLVWGSESLSSESEVLALSLKWPDTESHDPDLFTLARVQRYKPKGLQEEPPCATHVFFGKEK